MSTTDPANQPIPPAPPSDDPPKWAADLMQKLDALPSKLKASITDDDKKGIAESVHGLFERSGAFRQVDDEPAVDEPAVDEPAVVDADRAPEGGDSLARKWFGRW